MGGITDPSALQFMAPLIAFFALMLGLFANFRCDFIRLDVVTDDSSFSNYLGFGPWYRQGFVWYENGGQYYYSRTCIQYSDSITIDSNWKNSAIFSVVSVCIGGIALIIACIMPCYSVPRVGNKCIAFFFLLTAIFQGLTLLFLQSDACLNNPLLAADNVVPVSVTCNRAWGANASISSTAVWVFAAVLMVCIDFCNARKASEEEEEDINEENEDEVEEYVHGKDKFEGEKDKPEPVAAGP